MRNRIPDRVIRRKLQHWSVILLLVMLLPALGQAQYRARAAVTLVYFRASGVANGVFLEWETASELDNQGFFVNRSDSQNGSYTEVSGFIPTSGDPLLGGYYQFTDTDVVNGTTYWYKLEAVDIQSNSRLYDPPIFVMAGAGRTATPTATSTAPVSGSQTSTATRTGTASARTPTATATKRARSQTPTPTLSNPYPAVPTISGYQQPVQPPPASTAVNQEQPASGILTETLTIPVSGTATLIPLPEITMQFPGLAVSNPTIPTPPGMSRVSISEVLKWVTPTRVLIVIFILFVWLFLGGWFYSTMRRLE